MDPVGKTYYTIMPVLENCDTKSYSDMNKINAHHDKYSRGLISRKGGDGQFVVRMSDAKKLHPEEYCLYLCPALVPCATFDLGC